MCLGFTFIINWTWTRVKSWPSHPRTPSHPNPHAQTGEPFMEPTTVGSLWLENDLHEHEFESQMGRSTKFVRVISHEIHGNPRDLNMYRTGRSVALFHGRKSMPPIYESPWGERPWNWMCNSVNLCRSSVTWMRRDYLYDFTLISRWSTFSSTVNLCNINCVICSDTHRSFGPPIVAQSMSCGGVCNHENGMSKFDVIHDFI